MGFEKRGRMLEAELVRKIIKKLKERYPQGVWYKIHTGPFQERGIPDIIGCLNGLFIALEVKRPDNQKGATEIQKFQLKRISRAKGLSAVVQSVDEALKVISERITR